MKISLKKFVAVALGSALYISAPIASAQWVVFDPAALTQAIQEELNFLENMLITNGMSVQQLKDYKLQLKNLEKLEDKLRKDVKSHLKKQLLNNIKDYGKSLMNKTTTIDPDADTYYVNAEDIVKTSIGDVPRTTAATNVELNSLGMRTGADSSMSMNVTRDRQQYDRVMDDMRQVALTRSNSEIRADQANAISEKMASLDDNNTVGAIQLLAAQNALTYAQNEDSIKTQSALLKTAQEEQLRALVEREAERKRELARLAKARNERQAPTVNMVP